MKRVTLLRGICEEGEDVWINPKLILWTRRAYPPVGQREARVAYQAGDDVREMTCYLPNLRQVMEVIE